MKPGIYDISNEEYHASEGISRSAIAAIAKSPLHYYEQYVLLNGLIEKPTDAMNFGTAVHCLILEDNFDEHFAVVEQFDARTKEGKQYIEEFMRASEGKIILTRSEYNTALAMQQAVLSHPRAMKLIENALIEKSLYWNDPITGSLCKARPDGFKPDLGIVFDIKTTYDSSASSFQRSIIDFDYHIQAAMQLDAIKAVTDYKINDFIIIAVPKKSLYSYSPYLYHFTEEIIEFGREEYIKGLELIKRCTGKNEWQRDRHTVIPVYLLPYLRNSKFNSLLEIYQ